VSALAWRSQTDLQSELSPSISPGDLVRTGDNLHPHYRIIAQSDGRVWIRDTQHGTDHVVPLDRCTRI
jgi:hypothetical protein